MIKFQTVKNWASNLVVIKRLLHGDHGVEEVARRAVGYALKSEIIAHLFLHINTFIYLSQTKL